jgi:hypothetical protein
MEIFNVHGNLGASNPIAAKEAFWLHVPFYESMKIILSQLISMSPHKTSEMYTSPDLTKSQTAVAQIGCMNIRIIKRTWECGWKSTHFFPQIGIYIVSRFRVNALCFGIRLTKHIIWSV